MELLAGPSVVAATGGFPAIRRASAASLKYPRAFARRMRTHEAVIHLDLGAAQAAVVAGALSPETGGFGGEVPRTSSEVSVAGESLVLRLAADDAASLRAVVNSYLRWTKTALDVTAVASRPRRADGADLDVASPAPAQPAPSPAPNSPSPPRPPQDP